MNIENDRPKDACKLGVHSGHRVDFRSGISSQFKIVSCIHIGFYIILNSFGSRVNSDSVIKSDLF